MEASSAAYWSATDMDLQPQITVSNHTDLQNPGEITDPWGFNPQPSSAHPAQPSCSSPYISSSSATTTTHFTDSSYPYPHFSTNDYSYDTQQVDAPASVMSFSHSRPSIPLLPPDIPSNLPHMANGSGRVGLSEMWSLQGMRDMEAFERLCENTNQLVRMKPRGQRKSVKPNDNMASNSLTKVDESAICDQFLTIQTGRTGCSSLGPVPRAASNQADTDVAKTEYTNHDPRLSYISPDEPQYPDVVSSTDFSSTMSYSSAPAHHQNDLSSATASSMSSSSPLSDSTAFSSPVASSVMPPPPPLHMTVPSQSSAPLSPVTSRSTLRHPNILPAPSKRSGPTVTIDVGSNVRQKRNLTKMHLLRNNSDASSPNDPSHQSGTNSSAAGSHSPIQNGPVPGSSQARIASLEGAAESSKSSSSSARSRRGPSTNNTNSLTAAPDQPGSPEHELTETHTIPTADLDLFFHQAEQGCIGGRKAWMCPKCRKSVRKQDRASHKLSHEGKKRYDCRCGKQFGRPQDADRHIREQAPCGRCPGKMGRYGKDGLCSACVTEIEQGHGGT